MSDIHIPNSPSSGLSSLPLTVKFVVDAIALDEPSNNASCAYSPIIRQDWGPPESAESASNAYARFLLPRSIGYPLWFPEPSNYLPEYQRKGIGVGDLGYITFDGHFDFLFNICLPSDHPINYQAPPEFQPLEFNEESDVTTTPQIYTPGQFIASESIQMKSFKSDAEFRPNR
jgi:hypothetical protein